MYAKMGHGLLLECASQACALQSKDQGIVAMTTFRVQGERNGQAIDMRGGHLMRVAPDGKVAEGWGFASDQEALDAFFSA